MTKSSYHFCYGYSLWVATRKNGYSLSVSCMHCRYIRINSTSTIDCIINWVKFCTKVKTYLLMVPINCNLDCTLISSIIYSEIMTKLAYAFGILQACSSRQIRFNSELEGNWSKSSIRLYLSFNRIKKFQISFSQNLES